MGWISNSCTLWWIHDVKQIKDQRRFELKIFGSRLERTRMDSSMVTDERNHIIRTVHPCTEQLFVSVRKGSCRWSFYNCSLQNITVSALVRAVCTMIQPNLTGPVDRWVVLHRSDVQRSNRDPAIILALDLRTALFPIATDVRQTFANRRPLVCIRWTVFGPLAEGAHGTGEGGSKDCGTME